MIPLKLTAGSQVSFPRTWLLCLPPPTCSPKCWYRRGDEQGTQQQPKGGSLRAAIGGGEARKSVKITPLMPVVLSDGLQLYVPRYSKKGEFNLFSNQLKCCDLIKKYFPQFPYGMKDFQCLLFNSSYHFFGLSRRFHACKLWMQHNTQCINGSPNIRIFPPWVINFTTTFYATLNSTDLNPVINLFIIF